MSEMKLTQEEFDQVLEQSEAMTVVERKIREFVQDMRDLGQTEVAMTDGLRGFDISFKIKPKEKQ